MGYGIWEIRSGIGIIHKIGGNGLELFCFFIYTEYTMEYNGETGSFWSNIYFTFVLVCLSLQLRL